jgi:hypothetical protein
MGRIIESCARHHGGQWRRCPDGTSAQGAPQPPIGLSRFKNTLHGCGSCSVLHSFVQFVYVVGVSRAHPAWRCAAQRQ